MKKVLVIFFILLLTTYARAAVVSGYQGNFIPSVAVTIAISTQESSLINLNGFALVGITTPAALTGTAMTFESCASDGSSCVAIKSTTSGTALTYTVTTSSYYAIDPTPFQGVRYLKLKSGTSEGAARTLTVSLKGI